MTRPSLLIATTNPGKLREVCALLASSRISVTGLGEHDNWPEPIEDAETFEGNAILKACYYARLAGGWVVADDSGLEVDALDLRPGVMSARFAGSVRDDTANNAKLVSLLKDVPPEDRTARFRCVMALADPEGIKATASGVVDGLIRDEPLGDNGFGYDPHFFLPTERMTAAQLSPERKNRISHRGRALRELLPSIERYVLGLRQT